MVTETGWDLIVVGAGSAGAALAVRSAEKGKRVLLVEAGPNYRSAQMHEAWRSPNPIRALLDPTATEQLVWAGLDAARTEKQSHTPYWRGRGVGGSSSINGQIAIRPPMADFDDWVASGCTGWAPTDVLPYFAKLEDDEEYGDEPYHGRGGPTPVYRTPQEHWGSVDTALSRAAQAAGHAWAPDVNAPGAFGVSPYPINSRHQRRVSVNDGYLEGARDCSNLTIRGDATVDKLTFSGNRVNGVQVIVDGVASIEQADEVVLSAGAIHSPAILMRSGIGPASDLRALDIGVRQNLPVGRGFQDHPMAVVSIPLIEEAGIQSSDDRHTNVCVRYRSGAHAPEGDMMFVSQNQNVVAMANPDMRSLAGAFGVWVNQAHSRGELTLTSADFAVQPQIHSRMLSDERDLSRLRDGIRALVELARDPAVGSITHGALESENGALFAVLDNDSELDDYLLSTASDVQHATSTCRMGAIDDADTVVDPSCRVLGIDRLRVVDASIFPTVPRANTNLTAIMVGEVMADRLD
ncbi:GMC family oxidoreductase [Rhodococcoides yunnanense]|uniref:GMC family oxidoreductase n=1 Tax=Rhodococcoides yunnanense TaxID=278209 RepID=UPI0009339916|nr:GMC family oxidoreductase N-terminal domain-containing protein [Rhodococcus yunnanensis]